VLAAYSSFCQTATTTTAYTGTADIKGFVYDKNTIEPIIFTNVYLIGTQYGSQTDVNGFYSIKKIPAGSYRLICTYLGYDSTIIPIELKAGQTFTQKLFLSKKARSFKDIIISAKKQEKLNETKIGEIQATAVQIKALPSIGGEPDLAQYLQVVPGVVSSGDQGGQLYIRGGAPVQNKIMIDGMTIYNPFHSLGLFSVFETDLIKNADIKTAGFGANYGGATSAVVDVTTRDGNKKRLSGKLSLNTFTSKIILEGPLKKYKEGENGGSSSFILSAKNSYLNKTSKLFYNYADTNGNGLPYAFTDLYGKVSFASNGGSKLNLFAFNFHDKATFNNIASFGWNSSGGGANFVISPANSTTLVKGAFSYSVYHVSLSEGNKPPRTSSIGGFSAIVDLGNTLADYTSFNYGMEVNGFATQYHFVNQYGVTVGAGEDQNTTELAGYGLFKKSYHNKFVIEAGVRLPVYASLQEFRFEPRIATKYNLTENIRIKGGAGMYSQNLISTKSDRDIVNLFTGFLSGPDEPILSLDRKNEVKGKLQKSLQGVLGVEVDVKKHIEMNVESYIKDFTQLININRDKLFPQDPSFMVEQGYAYGGDFSLKFDYKQYYVWVVYALGYVNRYDGNSNTDGSKKYYAPPFDRRHNINILATYQFGKTLTWELGARWNFGSGFPFTNNGINTNVVSGNGTLGVYYDKEINGGRLPYYHRFDVSLKKKMYVGKNGMFEAVLSVTNLYDRANIFYYDRERNKRVNQLPILPALGVSYNF
jgi:CarboxypepD_reg-like domain/TonB-dependent Receptor Plug Domain